MLLPKISDLHYKKMKNKIMNDVNTKCFRNSWMKIDWLEYFGGDNMEKFLQPHNS